MRLVDTTKWPSEGARDAALAPHHYTADRIDAAEDAAAKAIENFNPTDTIGRHLAERRAYLAAVPYKCGDVVYIEREPGKIAKARIVGVFIERNQHDELREKFRVQLMTKAGTWSRVWVYTWPGYIQRGYNLVEALACFQWIGIARERFDYPTFQLHAKCWRDRIGDFKWRSWKDGA